MHNAVNYFVRLVFPGAVMASGFFLSSNVKNDSLEQKSSIFIWWFGTFLLPLHRQMTKEIFDMKKKEFVKRLKKAGCTFERQGARHEIWILPNGEKFPVPRHGSKEISSGVFNSVKDLLGL